MISLPHEPSGGMKILDWAREVQKCLRRLRLTSGPGIRLTEGTNGTAISADPARGAGSNPKRPFELEVTTDPADTSENPQPKIRIYPSTLAGGAHTQILGPGDDPLFSAGDDPPALLEPVEGVVFARVVWNPETMSITERKIALAEQLPEDDEENFYCQIGDVTSHQDQWKVYNVRYGPIEVFICGGSALWG